MASTKISNMERLDYSVSTYDGVAAVVPTDDWDGVSTPTTFKNVVFSPEVVVNRQVLLLAFEDIPRTKDFDNSQTWSSVVEYMPSTDAFWDNTNSQIKLKRTGIYEVSVTVEAVACDMYGAGLSWPWGSTELGVSAYMTGMTRVKSFSPSEYLSTAWAGRYLPVESLAMDHMNLTHKFYFRVVDADPFDPWFRLSSFVTGTSESDFPMQFKFGMSVAVKRLGEAVTIPA